MQQLPFPDDLPVPHLLRRCLSSDTGKDIDLGAVQKPSYLLQRSRRFLQIPVLHGSTDCPTSIGI